MSGLNISVPETFAGDETVHVKAQNVPTEFVQGRGADLVPSRVTQGVASVDSAETGSIAFYGVNNVGRAAILEAAKGIVEAGQDLTRAAIAEKLHWVV
jgi:hypothetical protein